MRAIANPQRGCGTLRAGGFYARSESSSVGVLSSAWCFGTGVERGHNLFITGHGDRAMNLCCLPSTLDKGVLMQSEQPLTGFYPVLATLPKTALVDHVGSNNYSPLSFAQEVFLHGVSRKIPETLAQKLAGKTLPILFTHSDVPVLPGALPPDEFQTSPQGQLEIEPSFANPTWGLYISNTSGSLHWMLKFLTAVEEDDTLLNRYGARPTEQAFFISWITNVVYISKPDDTPERYADIAAKGIEVVTLEDEAHVG